MTDFLTSRPRLKGREIFSAFVCDDQSADQVRATCQALNWPIDRVHKGGLKNAVQTLSVSSSPSILFIDLSETTHPLQDINALAEVCEPGTMVIAGGQMNDVRLYRDLLASGIQDYILKPFNPEQLRDSFSHAQTILSAPKQGDGDDIPRSQIGVVGVRGGVGASTIATALAWTFAEHERRTTAFFDLDAHFGTGALALDLDPGRGLADAIDNPARIDGLFLERALAKASEKLSILSAEVSISTPILTDGTAFHLLQEELRSSFECTVSDMPRDLVILHPHLLNEVQTLLLVAEPSLACARDTFRLLTWLKAQAPHVHPLVILNKQTSTAATEVIQSDFEKSIEQKVDVTLPEDAKTVRQSAKLGKAVTDAGKSSKLGAALLALGHQLANEAGAPEAQHSTKRSNSMDLSEMFQKLTGWGKAKGTSEKASYADG